MSIDRKNENVNQKKLSFLEKVGMLERPEPI